MKRDLDSFVEDLRRKVDIVDVISEHVQLRRSGRSYVGLCPFHNERTPSFSVSQERQLYHCFGCGAGGTVFRFVMDVEGLSFMETVQKLAHRVHLEVPFANTEQHSASPEQNRRQRMVEAHELATKLYNYILMNTDAGVQALTYLEKRGLSRQTVMDFRLGFAPRQGGTVVAFLRKRGFEPDLLVDSGLAVVVGDQIVDRFRGRVMIPIANAQGSTIAFGGRALATDVKPKYLNSPETALFRKGDLLFNLHQARKEVRKVQSAVLCEGYMDVIAAWQAGVRNCVASLGTSFTPEQSGLLKRYCTRVLVAYDGDSAGVTATARAVDIIEQAGLAVGVVLFPENLDPDDFIRKYGAGAFQEHLKTSVVSIIHFLLGKLRREANLQSAVGRDAFVRQALEFIGSRASPIEQEAELRTLASEFDISLQTLKEELSLIAKRTQRRDTVKLRTQLGPVSTPKELPRGSVTAGNRLLQAALADERSYQYLLDRGVDELVLPEQTALLALFYGFKADHAEGDAHGFLETLTDPELVRLASGLMIEDTPSFDESLLDDYLRTIVLEKLESAYKGALDRVIQAHKRQEYREIGELQRQVDELQQRISNMKWPQVVGRKTTEAKEAGKS